MTLTLQSCVNTCALEGYEIAGAVSLITLHFSFANSGRNMVSNATVVMLLTMVVPKQLLTRNAT